MARYTRKPRTRRSATRQPAARVLVRIVVAGGRGLEDAVVYLGMGARQTRHTLAKLHARNRLALDLAQRLVKGEATRYVRDSLASALAAIAAEVGE